MPLAKTDHTRFTRRDSITSTSKPRGPGSSVHTHAHNWQVALAFEHALLRPPHVSTRFFDQTRRLPPMHLGSTDCEPGQITSAAKLRNFSEARSAFSLCQLPERPLFVSAIAGSPCIRDVGCDRKQSPLSDGATWCRKSGCDRTHHRHPARTRPLKYFLRPHPPSSHTRDHARPHTEPFFLSHTDSRQGTAVLDAPDKCVAGLISSHSSIVPRLLISP